jgi:hypothetical protein
MADGRARISPLCSSSFTLSPSPLSLVSSPLSLSVLALRDRLFLCASSQALNIESRILKFMAALEAAGLPSATTSVGAPAQVD